MRLWINDILGRWQEQRIRTKAARTFFADYDENQAALESGGTIW